MDRILADCQYWTELNDVLDSFYVQYVVPEILSGTIFTEESSSFLGHDHYFMPYQNIISYGCLLSTLIIPTVK